MAKLLCPSYCLHCPPLITLWLFRSYYLSFLVVVVGKGVMGRLGTLHEEPLWLEIG